MLVGGVEGRLIGPWTWSIWAGRGIPFTMGQ
jgi:hypothetical protein